MTFNDRFVSRYIAQAPLALALERSYECEILSRQKFERPILDLGCGDGVFATILFQEQVDTGIDPDASELSSAKRLSGYKELICCGGERIPKEDGSYKTILSNSVLEHIGPIQDVLKEARRILSDDGRMFITVPTHRFEQFTLINQMLCAFGLKERSKKFRSFFNRFWKHYHTYDAARWTRLFDESGFSVVSSREYNPKTTCLLHDGLVPLSIGSFLSRRFLRRWFLSPAVRRFYAPLLSALFAPVVRRFYPVSTEGGLIFFEIKKK
jgi:ubiquinone/menaquinone biosynthesis C-methylase UbiE